MNFFERQERARSRTRLLLLLFFLGIALTIAVEYVFVKFTSLLGTPPRLLHLPDNASAAQVIGTGFRQTFRGQWYFDPLLICTAVATIFIIALGSLMQTLRIAKGGSAIARLLGAREVALDAADAPERRLRNVVEEMALASGTLVPRIFVMDAEPGINALSAGHAPGDSAIIVTKGALDKLARDELQGVIGHELSHIFSGDMRLNMRLMGLLAGMLLVGKIGRGLLGNLIDASRPKTFDMLRIVHGIFFGSTFAVTGFCSWFCGRLIKAAISRQREFLADASSVQFTRNLQGLAGALKKIQQAQNGSVISNKYAEDASHMFFSDAFHPVMKLLATHPTIEERLEALSSRFADMPHASAQMTGSDAHGSLEASGFQSRPRTINSTPGAAMATVGNPTAQHMIFAQSLLQGFPDSLRQATRSPDDARGIIYALLMEPPATAAPDVLQLQLDALDKAGETHALERAQAARKLLPALGDRVRLPLLDLCVPALCRMPPDGRAAFLKNVDLLIRADGRIDLFEFAVKTILF
ncbi:MAG: M48 family metalloprotease, partial [Deltaproteobacteria bacterium]|nr:M48 family metalloprotease [Deltaproteobacteria bacterium]